MADGNAKMPSVQFSSVQFSSVQFSGDIAPSPGCVKSLSYSIFQGNNYRRQGVARLTPVFYCVCGKGGGAEQ